jgi:hypothetical protein
VSLCVRVSKLGTRCRAHHYNFVLHVYSMVDRPMAEGLRMEGPMFEGYTVHEAEVNGGENMV